LTHSNNDHNPPRRLLARAQASRLLIVAAVAAAGLSALICSDAVAAPLAAAMPAGVESPTLQVRDGCGRGMRFSNSRQACVEDFGEGRGGGYDEGPRRYGDRPRGDGEGRGYGYRDAPRPDCGPGMRFSNSRQACVYID
jgi:hypothetical protein